MLKTEERSVWLAKVFGNRPYNKEEIISEISSFLSKADVAQLKASVLKRKLRRLERANNFTRGAAQ